MSVPKTIVQTHKDCESGFANRSTWIDKHPDFEYRFYQDEDCLDFFETCFPSLLSTYQKLPLPVQKADLFRYAYLYHFGGIYADVDTICYEAVPEYIDMTLDQISIGLEMTPLTNT